MRQIEKNKIYTGDALQTLKTLPPQIANTCITSPPYYGLRDYGVEGQLGLESSPEIYIAKLVEIFREVRRVLRDDGTLWVNIGDSYAGSGKGAANYPENAAKYKQGTNKGTVGKPSLVTTGNGKAKPKDLLGIPWMLAFALRDDGWYLRQDIIWAKPNPMPESVKDRCTKSHEYIFLFSKSRNYYFDAATIKEPCVQDEMAKGLRGGAYCGNATFDNSNGGNRKTIGNYKIPGGWDTKSGAHGTIHREGATRYVGSKYTADPDKFYRTKSGALYEPTGFRNKRDVWTVASRGFREAHFATFPVDLRGPCLLSGVPMGGVVIDPFMGAGTVGIAACNNGRSYLGIELNPEYVQMAENRIFEATRQITMWSMGAE